jgi:2-alkyl-3-oxoalkanoate reductase
MKVFVAGATGAIGRPLVSKLIRDGHAVYGMSRSFKRTEEIKKIGATPIIADALEFNSLLAALMHIEPEVVIEMLTSLPKQYTPQAMREASVANTKLILEGGANLQKAAQAVKARRYIVQSGAFWYSPGNGLASEQTPFAFEATPAIAAGTQIYATIENRVLHSKEIEGVALRFGFFYGPGTWFAQGGNMADQIRKGSYPIVGSGRGVWSFVHIEDAAAAIALALFAPVGIYNIVDDTPQELAIWLPAYARWLGCPLPPERTIDEELRLNGPDSVYYATQLRGASNVKAKQKLGFNPRPLEWMQP